MELHELADLAQAVGAATVVGGTIFALIQFFEYKKVSGIQRPHRIVTTIDGEPFAETSVSKVTINGNVGDNAFTMPQSAGGS